MRVVISAEKLMCFLRTFEEENRTKMVFSLKGVSFRLGLSWTQALC